LFGGACYKSAKLRETGDVLPTGAMRNGPMSDTRDRLLRAGEKLFRAQGYSGTGLKQLAAEAEAPWSSMYHFFPNGKEQLAEEVIRYGGDLYARMIRQCFVAYPDPREAIGAMFAGEARILRSSGFRNGCPVASVALDVASTTETVRKPCAEVFASWMAALAEGIAASGTPQDLATDLASYVLAALEGAIILSRTSRSVRPLEQTAQFVLHTLDAKLLRKARNARQGVKS
jgi:TetR/AcrR family transcriptional regulator, lmrAB and yxaGH operons repressor